LEREGAKQALLKPLSIENINSKTRMPTQILGSHRYLGELISAFLRDCKTERENRVLIKERRGSLTKGK